MCAGGARGKITVRQAVRRVRRVRHGMSGWNMVKINIIAVGRLKEKFFAEAMAEYAKRLSAYCSFSVTEIPPAPPSKAPAEQSAAETDALLAKVSGCAVALDGRGRRMSSETFARFIADKCSGGASEFSFLVGGSHGLDEKALKRADAVVSFGEMTFPHQLFRVMLAEQIYRAFTINAGTPYHK